MQKRTEFNIGNIVHLKSCSPDMEIVGVQGGEVAVKWRDDKGNPQRGAGGHERREDGGIDPPLHEQEKTGRDFSLGSK